MREEGLVDASRAPTDGEATKALAQLEEKHFPAPSLPDDEQLRQFYETHKDSFGIPATARVSQIQFVIPDSADSDEGEAATRKHAQEALRRIDAGESFAEVAKDMNQNAAALDAGGDLGYLPLGADTWLDRSVGGLNVGEHTGVIKSPAGYEILMVTDRKESIVAPFSEMRDAVSSAWVARKQSALRAEYLKHLAAHYGVTIEDEQLKTEYPNGLF
jgi:parvulin-like peptidyl-prolyl isomerase